MINKYPVELCKRIIKKCTFKGDIVMDIFGGVGSCAVAAKENDRNYISIDINEEFCKIAEGRLL